MAEGQSVVGAAPAGEAELRPTQIEMNGINVITDSERKGHPRDLFWPWFAANVSVLGLSYGAFVLGFGISFWQAVVVSLVGIIVSFLLVGFIAVAGKRGSAPTMVLGRAAFGVNGNKLPSVISWLLTVGWETVLVILATLATATVFDRLGWGGGTVTKVIALIVVVALTIFGGVMGFDLIMRMQSVITVVTAVLTVGFILVVDKIHWSTVSAIPSGDGQALIGALVFMMTGFGLGWVNAGADYSRYLPRRASGRGVVGWTTFGSSIAPIVLVVFGLLLAGSSKALSAAIAADPIGALANLLPTWYLIPFVIVAVLGLVGGSVLDIYSSGLALLTLGVRVPRYVAALIDGTIMTLGAIYVVFIAHSTFVVQFEGFLITLGVPIAAWCGIMLADILLRHRDYAERDLFSPSGRYGDIRWFPVGVIVVGTVLGWGLVTNASASWLTWQGYLLGPFGLGGKSGAWAFANLGVLVALAFGFVVTWAFGRAAVRAQEAAPVEPAPAVA